LQQEIAIVYRCLPLGRGQKGWEAPPHLSKRSGRWHSPLELVGPFWPGLPDHQIPRDEMHSAAHVYAAHVHETTEMCRCSLELFGPQRLIHTTVKSQYHKGWWCACAREVPRSRPVQKVEVCLHARGLRHDHAALCACLCAGATYNVSPPRLQAVADHCAFRGVPGHHPASGFAYPPVHVCTCVRACTRACV